MNASQKKPASSVSPHQAALKTAKTGLSLLLVGLLCVGLLCAMMAARQVGAMQMVEQPDSIRSAPSATVAVVENPEITIRVLENLLRSIVYSPADLQPLTNGAQKRGLDLGISRGFSGSQAGKHLMGLSAASFANGPGRR